MPVKGGLRRRRGRIRLATAVVLAFSALFVVLFSSTRAFIRHNDNPPERVVEEARERSQPVSVQAPQSDAGAKNATIHAREGDGESQQGEESKPDVATEGSKRGKREVPPALEGLKEGQEIFVTFGTSSVRDFVYNWLIHTRERGLSPRIVGSLDDGMKELCEGWGAPSILLRGHSVLDRREVTFLRINDKSFKKMGSVKTLFIYDLLDLGFKPIVSDADVVWLRDPRKYFLSKSYAHADVLVSNDCIDIPGDRADHGACGHVNVNTGIMHFRPTEATKRFVGEWHERVRDAQEVWMRDQPAFNLLIKEGIHGRLPGRIPPGGDRRLLGAHRGNLSLGVLPNWLFTNGHTFFVQKQHQRYSRPEEEPYAVHLTFQYGDAADYGYGKRQRLRQEYLWRPDTDEYFQGKFLALSEKGTRVEFEGSEGVGDDWYTAIYRHFAEDWQRRNAILNGLALAQALNRTLVLPRFRCFCDKIWNSLNRCRAPGGESTALPFDCPMDHIVHLDRWFHKGVDFREPGFLDNPRVPESLKATQARVHVEPLPGFPQYESFKNEAQVNISGGLSVESMAEQLAPLENVSLIEVDNLSEGTLCAYASERRNAEFDKLAKIVRPLPFLLVHLFFETRACLIRSCLSTRCITASTRCGCTCKGGRTSIPMSRGWSSATAAWRIMRRDRGGSQSTARWSTLFSPTRRAPAIGASPCQRYFPPMSAPGSVALPHEGLGLVVLSEVIDQMRYCASTPPRPLSRIEERGRTNER